MKYLIPIEGLEDLSGALEVLDSFGAFAGIAFVYEENVDALKQSQRWLRNLCQMCFGLVRPSPAPARVVAWSLESSGIERVELVIRL